VADAARKQAALDSFVTGHGNQFVELKTATDDWVKQQETKITEHKAIIDAAQRQHDEVQRECHDESVRLDAVIEFFTLDTGASKLAPKT
jgi:Holliday junction resolvase-like predicted endonuclease